jgi:hypothetical protein
MAMDFPGQPTVGQVYTVGGLSYVWNGYAWAGGGSQPLPATTIVSDTPPANPRAGQTWWESDTGILFMNYDDGNGPAQWVQINATIPSVPADGNEYVWVNNIWRLKEQSFVADGKAQQDILVPAGAKMCQLIGVCFNATAAINQVGLRMSLDGTTFLAGATDYSVGGGTHATGSGGYQNIVSASASFVPLTGAGDLVQPPFNFSTEVNLTRPTLTTYFGLKSFGQSYHSAAANLIMHQWMLGHSAPATSLVVKALRLIMAYGGNFGVNSTINARWMY